ncbi:MAG: D-alanine--D-alanine ligase [Pseudomonadota bacterium]
MSQARRYQRVAILMGGPSAEREVSLSSGRECAAGARDAGYDVIEIDAGPDLPAALAAAKPDAVFNALHGRWGEDGCVQGLLEWLRIPYTHSGVFASALAMDKARSKTVFAEAGLPIAPEALARPEEIEAAHLLPPPYVIKPIAEGSSVGVLIVREGEPPADLTPLREAGVMAERLMVEAYAPGRELTVSVLGETPLVVTEIFSDGWYDYEAKYAAGGSRHVLPADLPEDVTQAALAAALTAHRALGCRGCSRTDLRYDDAGPGVGGEKLIILETNSQPGMTPTSLLPEQAQHRGVAFDALMAQLIEDASLDR